MADLEIRNLHVNAEDKEILNGLDLEVSKGEVHALMGPNGSGKSTLANTIMGHPALEVTEGEILFEGEDITEADPEERSRAGLFMAFQYPVAIPGVTVANYLRMAINAHREARGEPQISLKDFRRRRRGGDGAGRHPARVLEPLPQRRLLGRREEAARDPPAGDAEAADRGPRRDRLRPRHRRAADRRRGRQQVLRPRHGRPDHHPLPAHPAPGRARLRPRDVRRAASSRRAGPSWSPSSRTRATAGSARRSRRPREPSPPPTFPIERVRASFPALEREVHGRPVAYLDSRRQRPAGARLDPGGRPLRAPPPRQRPPRLAHALGRGDRRLRGRPRDGRRPHRRGRPPRGDLRPQRDRGDQPGRPRLGRRQRRRRRPDRAHRDGAPLEHRPLAAARRARRRRDRLGAGRPTTACSTSTPTRRCSSAARSWSPSPTSRTCSAPRTRSPRSRASPTRPAPWCSPTAPRRRRSWPLDVAELGVDFYALTGHKALRADRDRRALGPARAAARRCRRSWAAAR